MAESLVKLWSMITMVYNKVLDPALCGGSVAGLAPEIYVIFLFYDTFKLLR